MSESSLPHSAQSQLAAFARDIKLSHTIFALPFALSAAWMVHRAAPVPLLDWVAIVAAMVTARSSAMGMNRILDRKIDRANPRTEGRAVASGALTLPWAWGLTLGSGALFVLCAALLNAVAFWLSPVVLLWLWGYSLAKRWTPFAHVWLGVALGLSPPCVWIALTGGVEGPALVMAGIIATWVAGFDILYALQDEAYDRSVGLRSIPAWLGTRGALVAGAGLHFVAVCLLCLLPFTLSGSGVLSWPYGLAVLAIAGILVWEHSLLKPGDLSKMNAAFFQANSAVSVVFAAGVFGSALV